MQGQALKSVHAKTAANGQSSMLPEMSTFCPFCGQALTETLIDSFYRCKSCQLAVRREEDMPEPLGHYNDCWARGEKDARPNLTRARFAAKQIRQLGQIESILDVGCGVGITVDILSGNYLRVDGIDTSPDSIAHARQRARGNFEQSSLEDWDPKRHYDVILSTQLIEHLRQPELFLAEAAKRLNAGGYIVLETPNLECWNPRSIWRSRIGGMYYGKDHRIIYTLKSLTKLLLKNGFEVVKATTITYSPTIVEELLHPLKGFAVRGQTEQFVEKQQAEKQRRAISRNVLVSTLARVAYRGIYRGVDNVLGDLLLLIPNKLSELRDRGNQAFVIGRLLK